MTSFRKISEAMAPQRAKLGNPILSFRELASFHRWIGGQIGTGYAIDNTDHAFILKKANDVSSIPQGTIKNINDAILILDLSPNGVTRTPSNISMWQIFNRHPDDKSNQFRFLSYNTFLLNGLEIHIIDHTINLGAKPTTFQRAPIIGQKIKSDYDIACLYEVFTGSLFGNMLDNWETRPGYREGEDKSGLKSIVQKGNISRSAKMAFNEKGKLLDSDYHANKGVLFTGINVGIGELEIFSTHLFYGGGLPVSDLGIISDLDSDLKESDAGERSHVKLTEVDELISFYHTHHHHQNVAIIVGDFNIDANANMNRDSMDEYGREYRQLRQKMSSINMYDLWIWDIYKRKPNSGYTCRLTDDEDHMDMYFSTCKEDKLIDDCCNDFETEHPLRMQIGEGRLDFAFVQKPEPQHKFNVDFSMPQRRAFKQETVDGKHVEHFLSDHLGLSFDIFVSAK